MLLYSRHLYLYLHNYKHKCICIILNNQMRPLPPPLIHHQTDIISLEYINTGVETNYTKFNNFKKRMLKSHTHTQIHSHIFTFLTIYTLCSTRWRWNKTMNNGYLTVIVFFFFLTFFFSHKLPCHMMRARLFHFTLNLYINNITTMCVHTKL